MSQSSKNHSSPHISAPDALARPLPPTVLHAKSPARPALFCRLAWLDELCAVPHWAPEGDLSLALRAREP